MSEVLSWVAAKPPEFWVQLGFIAVAGFMVGLMKSDEVERK